MDFTLKKKQQESFH